MMMHVVVKELSRVSPGFAMGFGVSIGLVGGAIVAKGTADQIERWGLPLATLQTDRLVVPDRARRRLRRVRLDAHDRRARRRAATC